MKKRLFCSCFSEIKYKLEMSLISKIEEWELTLKWIETAQVDVETRTDITIQMEKAKILMANKRFKNAADGFSIRSKCQ